MSKWEKHDGKIVIQTNTVLHTMNTGWFRSTGIVREFNFAARQVTTITESIFANTAKNTMTMAQQQSVQNFRDIEGKDAIIEAHEQLTRLGGNPEPLSDYVSEGLDKPKGSVAGLK